MARAVAIAVLALFGACHLAFRSELDRPDVPDAPGSIDAAPDAAVTVCPGGASPITRRAPTVADAVLIDASTQAFGRLPSVYLNYGTSIKSVGIWRFSLADVAAPPASWLEARVVLEWLPADDDCAPGCGACDAFEEQGMFELYPIRDEWDELSVSWTARRSGTAWSEPGAAGTDRGPFTARATHVPRQRLVFPVAPAEIAGIAPWIDGSSLSVVVVPKANPGGTGARMIVPALPPRASCSPPDPPSFLEVDFCP
jgi:hypothetical protein